MPVRPEPLRGEVWDVWFHRIGEHPAVIISVNAVNRRLGHVVAIPVTGNPGPPLTHVTLTRETALTRYAESYANITDIQSVSRDRCRRRRGLLATSELRTIETQLRVYLAL